MTFVAPCAGGDIIREKRSAKNAELNSKQDGEQCTGFQFI